MPFSNEATAYKIFSYDKYPEMILSLKFYDIDFIIKLIRHIIAEYYLFVNPELNSVDISVSEIIKKVDDLVEKIKETHSVSTIIKNNSTDIMDDIIKVVNNEQVAMTEEKEVTEEKGKQNNIKNEKKKIKTLSSAFGKNNN